MSAILPPVRYRENQWEHALHFERDNAQRVEMAVTHVASEPTFSIVTYRTKNNPNCKPSEQVTLSMEEARYLRALLNRPEVLEVLDEDETEQGDGTALSLFYNAATIRKLERLAQATAHQWKSGFSKRLDLLRFCAFILVAVDQQAYQARIDTLEDAGLFALELDKAGEVIREEINAYANNPDSPVELHSIYDEIDRLDHHFWGLRYYLSDEYLARRAKILERGKGPLLARFVAKLARRHYAQQQ